MKKSDFFCAQKIKSGVGEIIAGVVAYEIPLKIYWIRTHNDYIS